MVKIEDVEVFRVNLPLRKPMKLASERISVAQNLLVRITSSEGVIGWGEAASAPTMTGETQASMFDCASRTIAPAIKAQALDTAADLRRIESLIEACAAANPSSRAAVIMALYDLFARQTHIPLWQLFGEFKRERIPALLIIGDEDHTREIEQTRAGLLAGIVHIKIKVGAGDPLTDAGRVATIREVCGWDVVISADANMGWTEDQARVFLEAARPSKLQYLEQALAPEDLAGVGRLSRLGLTDLAVDEGLHGLADLGTQAKLGVRWFGLKLIKLGGYRQLQQAAAFCDAAHHHPILACKIAESSIAASAMAHFSATLPRLDSGVSFSHSYLLHDLVETPLDIIRGYASVPKGNGHGANVDLHAVKAFEAR